MTAKTDAIEAIEQLQATVTVATNLGLQVPTHTTPIKFPKTNLTTALAGIHDKVAAISEA